MRTSDGAQFTQGRPRGRKNHVKRGAKGPGVMHGHSLSLFPLRIFWVGLPSCLEDVIFLYFLNNTEL